MDLIGVIRGIVSGLFFAINLVFWTSLLIAVSLLKVLIPIPIIRKYLTIIITKIASLWVLGNKLNIEWTQNTDIQIHGMPELSTKGWYFVLANHQSWVDSVILQSIFLNKIPFLKFFLKQELIWVPFLGPCWWALDFPFMKRYSKEFIKKNPHLKGKDIETTKKACEKYREMPTTVMNYLEGTRFTSKKQKSTHSPYKNLLKPKAGGLSFAIDSMGDIFHEIVDVTIYYGDEHKTLIDLFTGKIKTIRVHIKTLPVPKELYSQVLTDEEKQLKAREFVNQLWKEKDQLIESFKGQKIKGKSPKLSSFPLTH